MLSVGERPRVLKWFHAGPMLFGDWGTSRLYVLGLAFASNGISNANRDYLKAGGSNFFCGDGNINYQRESIVELYYSMKINRVLWATADVQRINNPCYNADRGPVNVYSVRMHFEY